MNRRVLLVYPPSRIVTDYAPIGVSSLAAYLLKKDSSAEVRIVDYNLDKFFPETWQTELRDFKPDIVGICALSVNYPTGKEIAGLTRQTAPNTLVVMGGVHATMKAEDCLEHCDIVVRAEGELTFDEICQGARWEDIKGISFKKDGKTVHNEARQRIDNLDEMPFPATQLLKVNQYRAFPRWTVIGSRGCPYDCSFCCSPVMWKRVIKFRSPKNIVDEVEYLHSKFGIKAIDFVDDTINIPQQRAFEICDQIISRGLHKEMSFACSIRANKQFVSLEMFQKMKEANIQLIGLGVESASPKVLKLMRKSLTMDEVSQAIKLARKAGIERVIGYFIVGNWGETLPDVFKSWRFATRNNFEPSFSICTPYPGTTFNQLLQEGGYLKGEPDWSNFNQNTPIVRTDKMSRPAILLVFTVSVTLQSFLFMIRGRKGARYSPIRIIRYGFRRAALLTRSMWQLRRKS